MSKVKESSALSEMNQLADQAETVGGIAWRIEHGEKIAVLQLGEIAELLGDPVGPDYNGDTTQADKLNDALKAGRLKRDTFTNGWHNDRWPRTARNSYRMQSFYRHTLKAFFNGSTNSPLLDLWINSDYEAGFEPVGTFIDEQYLNNFYRKQYADETLKRFSAEGVSNPTKKQLFDRCRIMAAETWPQLFKQSDSELTAIFLDDPSWKGARA